MDYRMPPARTREYAESLRDSLLREQGRIRVLIEDRDARAATACERVAPWYWADLHGALGLRRGIDQHFGPNIEARMRAVEYREYAEKLRGELFPAVAIPELPAVPTADEALESFFDELGRSRDALDAVEEGVRSDERKLDELESRRCPERVESFVDQNQTEMGMYRRAVDNRRRQEKQCAAFQVKYQPPSPAASPASEVGLPLLGCLAAALVFGVPIGLLVLMPFIRIAPGTAAAIILSSMSLGVLVAYRSRRVGTRQTDG
ncbi:MAG: hypothetical protein KC731_30330 [Myxococcales bacterium]|nr:hypothetical protein [Myxococcales bacterium]